MIKIISDNLLFFILSNKVLAGDILYYSATDGTVSVNTATGIEATSISSANFKGAIVGASMKLLIRSPACFGIQLQIIYFSHTTHSAEGLLYPQQQNYWCNCWWSPAFIYRLFTPSFIGYYNQRRHSKV